MSSLPPQESFGSTALRGMTISTAGNIVLRLFDFFIAVFMLRWLSLFEYGLYQLALSTYDFCAGLLLPGIDTVVISDVSGTVSQNSQRAKNIFSVYIGALFFFSILAGLFFFFGSSWLGRFVGASQNSFKIVALLFFLLPFDTACSMRFQIFLDFGWGMFFRLLRGCFRLVAMSSFFVLSEFHLSQALFSLVLSVAAPVLVVYLFYHTKVKLFTLPSLAEFRVVWGGLFAAHGKWAILEDIVGNVSKNIRPFIIKIFAGVEAVALFSVAQSLLGYVVSVFPLRDVLTPMFPRSVHDRPTLVLQLNRSIKYATFAYVFLALLAAVGVPALIWVFFPKYSSALPLFYILLVGLPWLGPRSVMLPVFYALKAQRVLFVMTIMRTTWVVLLGVLLTYFFGVYGAAVEAMLVGVLLTPTFALVLRRILPEWKVSPRYFFSFTDEDKILFASIRNRFNSLVSGS